MTLLSMAFNVLRYAMLPMPVLMAQSGDMETI
jgi:hypothetical protein